MLSENLKQTLIELANKYERRDFLDKDPSKFMHFYSDPKEQELVAFIAANLAFGRREQILLHIEKILEQAGDKPSTWILSQKYKDFFTAGNKSFYRLFTHNDMVLFFDGLKTMLEEAGSAGAFVKQKWEQSDKSKTPYLHQILQECFAKECGLIPFTKETSAKRLNMLLRWLVRQNSPVDLGVWNWYSPSKLLMPLDTHVMQQSVELGLLSRTSAGKIPGASLKTAVKLTQLMKEVFPEDPVRGDFALFGLGVNRGDRPLN